MNKLVRGILGIATAAYLLIAPQVKAQTTEMMAAKDYQTIDTKFLGKIAPKTNYFARTRITINDKDEVGAFFVTELSYNIKGGLDAVAELQAISGVGTDSRVGAQYFNQSKDFNENGGVRIYALGTKSLERNNFELITLLEYCPKIAKNTKLFTHLETVTNGHKELSFAVQRLRLGLDIKGLRFGFAGDISQSGKKADLGYNLGVFVGKDF